MQTYSLKSIVMEKNKRTRPDCWTFRLLVPCILGFWIGVASLITKEIPVAVTWSAFTAAAVSLLALVLHIKKITT